MVTLPTQVLWGHITADRTLTFTGTGTPGASLELMNRNAGFSTVALLSAIPANGIWTVTFGDVGSYASELLNGIYDIVAGSRDGIHSSLLSDPLFVTVVGAYLSEIDLTAWSDTGISASDNYTSDATPTIAFTAGAGDTLEIDWGDGRGFQSVGTGTDASQQFTIDEVYPFNPPEGERTIQVRATNDGDSTTESFTYFLDRLLTSPRGSFSAASDTGSSQTDRITNDTTPTIIGTGEPGATIEVKIGGGLDPKVATAIVDSSGNWTATLPVQLDGTSSTLTFRSEDLAGNVSQLSGNSFTIDTTALGAPFINTITNDTGRSGTDGITNDNRLFLSGSTEADSVVTVYSNGNLVGSDTTTSTGIWSVSTTILADGDHTLTATATDRAGNISVLTTGIDFTIDTVAPMAPTVALAPLSDSGTSNTDNVTRDNTPRLTGTAEIGATVEIFSGFTSLGTTTANTAGNWSFTSPVLSDGEKTITARSADAAGNVGPSSSPLSITVDTSAPAAPTITLAPASDSGASSTDNITNNTTLTLTGTAEIGATVEIYFGAPLIGITTADGSGNWSFTTVVLADGVYPFSARQIDVAGNHSSSASSPLSVTVKTTAPATPTITSIANDTGVSSSDGITQDREPVVSGTGEPGSTVFVNIASSDVTLTNDTVVGADGLWSLSFVGQYFDGEVWGFADGTITTTVFARDAAGNQSATTAPITGLIDNVAPGQPTIFLNATSDSGESNSGDITNDATPSLIGTAEANSTVEIFNGTTSVGSTTANADGDWSFTSATLADGAYSFTATARDAAGNTSAPSTALALSIDTTAPAAPVITGFGADSGVAGDGLTSDATPTLSGTAAAGAIVTILLDGNYVGSTTANADGEWSFQTAQLDIGVYAFSALAVDLAGNGSEQSDILSVQIISGSGSKPVILSISADTGTSAIDGITMESSPIFSGTGAAGEVITVYDGDTVLATTVVGQGGVWNAALEDAVLPNGDYVITATSSPAGGPASARSDEFILTVDTVAPQLTAPDLVASSDTGDLQTDNLTNDISPTINFTAQAGAPLEVNWGKGEGFVAAGVATGGNQTLTLANGYQQDGAKTIQLRATDTAGNTSLTSLDLVIDTLAPISGAVLGISPDTANAGDRITSEQQLVFNGTAAPDTAVRVFLNGVAIGSSVSNMAGAWTFDYTDVTLEAGGYELTVISTDTAGNVAGQATAFDFTVADLSESDVIVQSIAPATTYEVGTVVAELGVSGTTGNASYRLVNDLDGAITIRGNQIVIAAEFEPDTFRSLNIDVIATISGGEQIRNTLDISGFIAVDLVGDDGIIRGGPDDDTIVGTQAEEIVFAGFGDDYVEGGSGNDALNGGAGNDTLTDRDGDDVLDGADGDDVLTAMNGRNVLLGGNGHDL